MNKLNEGLNRSIEANTQRSPAIKLESDREAKNHLLISGRGLTLSIMWNCSYANTLDGSILLVEGYKTKFDVEGHRTTIEGDRFYHAEYDIDINNDFKVAWEMRASHEKSIPTNELARNLLSYLLGSIRNKI
jgi:hypothetical protein